MTGNIGVRHHTRAPLLRCAFLGATSLLTAGSFPPLLSPARLSVALRAPRDWAPGVDRPWVYDRGQIQHERIR